MTTPGKLIGQGLQYRVYRISKTRVRKIQTTHQQKMATLRSWKLCKTEKARVRFARNSARVLATSLQGLAYIHAHVDAKLLGNPVFLADMQYEQDYIQPLGNYLETHAIVQNKRCIDSYIGLVITLWQCGFADTIFNFAINNGVVDGEAVQLDLGELTFVKNKIRAQIQRQHWLRKESFNNLTDQELKRYFKKEMRRRLTLKTLDRNWKIALAN